jgi:tetratricopeptide (TPR) repeat protein
MITSAQGVITTPRTPSPAAKVQQTIGISTVTVKYSRPSVKDREVWGKLVPYGLNKEGFGSGNPSPWRAGANENTTIEFSHDAQVEGKAVPAGTYGLFFIVNPDNKGELILSKDHDSWGNFWYDPAHDQMRAPITMRDASHTEMLTYDFLNLTKNAGELVLSWEKKQFPVKIEFAVDDIVMANAVEQLKGTVGFTAQGYQSAANYALNNKVNLEKGLVWIDQAIAQNKNYTNLNIKSGLRKEIGKTTEADAIAKESLNIATENELNNYGYQLLGQENYDKAIEIFTMNTKRNPKSANCFDSLGEGYALKGDKTNAVKNFKKALDLDPPQNVRANSEKYLKQFGAL